MNNVRSEASLARQGKLKRRRFRGPGECNGCENECQGIALESSRQAVPILRTLCSPSVEDSTFAIAIINFTI